MLELFAWNSSLVVGATGALIGLLALLHRVENRVFGVLFRRIGWRASLYPTAIVGVPLHELSHIAAAKLFGHRIVGFSLFEPDPATGTLGYVRHAYRHRNARQFIGTFFIGIAPFVVGAVALLTIGATLLPAAARAELLLRGRELVTSGAEPADALALAKYALASVEASPWLVLQLYLAVAVASHMAPSARDLSGGLLGALALAVMVAAGVTLLSAMELTALPLLVLVVPFAAFSILALGLQGAWVFAVAVITRPVRRTAAVTR